MPVVYAGPFSILRCGADNGWWSTTLIAPTDDRRFRALSDQATLLRTLAALPPTQDWVDPDRAEPFGGIVPMFIPFDGRRRYVVEGEPCLAGLTAVGEAVGVTNPTLGRGTTFALMQAIGLRDVLREHEDPASVTARHHELLEAEFQPWWQQTVDSDRDTLERMRTLAAGQEPPPPGPGTVFRQAGEHDPELWRCLLEIAGVLTPIQDVLDRPGTAPRIEQTLQRVGPPTSLEVDLDALLDPDRTHGPEQCPRRGP